MVGVLVRFVVKTKPKGASPATELLVTVVYAWFKIEEFHLQLSSYVPVSIFPLGHRGWLVLQTFPKELRLMN